MMQLLLFFITHCMMIIGLSGLTVEIPAEHTLNGEKVRFSIEIGDSVFKKISVYCTDYGGSSLDRDHCAFYAHEVSGHLYGHRYTPSRNNSTVEDFYASRTDIIQYITQRRKVRKYLEIGCDMDLTFATMKSIDVGVDALISSQVKHSLDVSICVDPLRGGTHRMTSDEFFQQNNITFDLIFVDGLHEAHQVMRDVFNGLRWLKADGIIVMHDCNPSRYEYQVTPPLNDSDVGIWNGDTWRAAVALRLQDGLEIVIGDFEHGVGVIRRKLNRHRLPVEWERKLLTKNPIDALGWEDLDQNREVLHRLMTLNEVKKWLDSD